MVEFECILKSVVHKKRPQDDLYQLNIVVEANISEGELREIIKAFKDQGMPFKAELQKPTYCAIIPDTNTTVFKLL